MTEYDRLVEPVVEVMEPMDAPGLAREVNERIYEIVVKYGDDVDIDYLCECGCMRVVRLSPDEYMARGAVYEGHIRPSTANATHDR